MTTNPARRSPHFELYSCQAPLTGRIQHWLRSNSQNRLARNEHTWHQDTKIEPRVQWLSRANQSCHGCQRCRSIPSHWRRRGSFKATSNGIIFQFSSGNLKTWPNDFKLREYSLMHGIYCTALVPLVDIQKQDFHVTYYDVFVLDVMRPAVLQCCVVR